MLSQIEKIYAKITIELAPPAGRITLSHPPLNIIDLPMMDELLAAIQSIEARGDISFVVLAGSPRAFSAGVDIAAHQPPQVRVMLMKFHAVLRTLMASRKITLAAVRGNCIGGGAELALACDMIFCTENSVWQFPEINLACFPPMAVVALAPAVGRKRAAELIFTGQVIHGDEAFHLGLANDAVADADLDDLVDEVGGRLAALSPVALASAKKAFATMDASQFEQKLQAAEAIYLDELMPAEDAREGISAFLEKRKPVWKGR